MSVVALLFVQSEAALHWVGGSQACRASWDRLLQVRGIEKSVVVTSPELQDKVRVALAKATQPTLGIHIWAGSLSESISSVVMDMLISNVNIMPDDVFVADRGLCPFMGLGTLEAMVDKSAADCKFTITSRQVTALQAAAGKWTLAKVEVVNTTVGVYRHATDAHQLVSVPATAIEMLQIDQPADMNIACALAMYGVDK